LPFCKVNFEKEKELSTTTTTNIVSSVWNVFSQPLSLPLHPASPPSPLSLSLSLSRSLQLSSLQANAEAASIRIKKPRRGRPGISLFLCDLKTRFTCLAVFDIQEDCVSWMCKQLLVNECDCFFKFPPSLWTHQEKIIKQASFRLPTACFFNVIVVLKRIRFESWETDRQTDSQRKKSVTGDSRLWRNEVWRCVWSRGCLM
jgi:hypothetical protein